CWNSGQRCSAKENNVSSGKEKNCSGPKSQMGEDQKAVARGKRQTLQLRITKNLSRRSKANRCSSKSKMGTSESTASEESSVVVVQDSEFKGPGIKLGPFASVIVHSGVNECNRLITTTTA